MTTEEKKSWIIKNWITLDRQLLTTALKRYWGVEKSAGQVQKKDDGDYMADLLSK